MKMWQIILAGLIIGLSGSFSSSLEGTVDEVLQKISQRAKESQTDVILITHKGEPIFVYDGDKRYEPIETRSITKSFVSLAVGMLLQEGKIVSTDTPVHCFFPEMNQGMKKDMTIRHLLNNTSGIAVDEACAGIYQAPDSVKYAIASDLSSYPGTHFIYNNKAVNLLSGIVEKASGMRVHEYLRSRLFQPLGISSDTWLSDVSGNNYAMSHLTLNALDLSKVGLVLANGGCWNGRRLIASEWIEAIAQPGQSINPFYGLLWWMDYNSLDIYWDASILELYRNEGVSECYVRSLEQLSGQVFTFTGNVTYGNFSEKCAAQLAQSFGSVDAVYRFFIEVESKGLPLGRWNEGYLKSFSARGYLGQKLLIMPAEKIVAVRLAKSCGQSGCKIDTFADFEEILEELVRKMAAQ